MVLSLLCPMHTQSLRPVSETLVPKQYCFGAPLVDLLPDGEKYPPTPLLLTPIMQLGSFRTLVHCLMAVGQDPLGTSFFLCTLETNLTAHRDVQEAYFED